MEHFLRSFYRWLPLSIKQKTSLRKFVSTYLWRVILKSGKINFYRKQYFLGHSLDSVDKEQLRGMIVSYYEMVQQDTASSQLVSIVIPVRNHIDFTIRCLLAIARAKNKARYEIIVADDASDDETSNVLGEVKAIKYLRSEENLGFLKTCNRAAKTATGSYLLFLNNDTVVQDGWLDGLLETFMDFPRAGLVGSKLIYPDGRLQEAGGIIWIDGTGRNYGWGDNPNKPKYNYLREVDYCSGASIMIPRTLWEKLNGFDEVFSPAYYEDTDLAFRVRAAGYKVFYQPASEILHFEGVTSGIEIDSGVKKYQEINRHKFVQKWEDILAHHEDNASGDEYIFKNRYARGRILYIDSSTPAPDRDSGSIDAFHYLYILKKLGCEVTLIPASNLGYEYPYTGELQRKGVECLYYPYIKNVDRFLQTQGNRYDVVFLSRFTIASQYLDTVVKYMPQAKIVFNTVDLHFLREKRAAQIHNSSQKLNQSYEIQRRELSIIEKVDHTMVVSEAEYAILHEHLPQASISIIPIPRHIYGSSSDYENRHDIVFIGGYNHLPNVDAVKYFLNEIWPSVLEQLPVVRFIIAGSNMPSEFNKYASESIIIKGYVDDLGILFNQCRLSVVPLRFGSGIKGKIVTSLSYGVPCVATSIAAEGMGLVKDYHILQADSPKDFADAVVEAYINPKIWHELSKNGLTIVQEKYSLDVVEEKMVDLLKSLDVNVP